MIGDLRKTLINHVLQVVQYEYDDKDDDDEKGEDIDDDLNRASLWAKSCTGTVNSLCDFM